MDARSLTPKTDSLRLAGRMVFYFVPLSCANILQALAASVIAAHVGLHLGANALAAVAITMPFQFMLNSLIAGLASGAVVLIGRAYGARDEATLKKIAGTTVTIVAAAAIALCIAGRMLVDYILPLPKASPEFVTQAIAYARAVLLIVPIQYLYTIYNSMIAGTGLSRVQLFSTAAYVALLALFLKLSLTFVALAPFPMMPIEGVAYSSLAAYGTVLVSLQIFLISTKHVLNPNSSFIRQLRIKREVVAEIVRVGLPTAVLLMAWSAVELAILSIVSRMGPTVTAAHGVTGIVAGFFVFPAVSIGFTASYFAAHAHGAKESHTLGPILRIAISMNVVFVGGASLAVFFLAPQVVSIFTGDAELIRNATFALRATTWGYVLYGASLAISGMLRGSKDVLWPTILSIAAAWLVTYPLALALAPIYGLRGIWLSYPISHAALFVAQGVYIYLRWPRLVGSSRD